MSSRGRINPQCFDKAHGPVYNRGECYLSQSSIYTGAEYIAQARYIADVNDSTGPVGQVSPDIEWETTVSGSSRTDIMQRVGGDWKNLQLVELKGDWMGGTAGAKAEALDQVTRYTLNLVDLGFSVVPFNNQGYADTFSIRCKGTTGDSQVTQYTVSWAAAGVLLIHTGQSACGGRQQTAQQDQEEDNTEDDSADNDTFTNVSAADPHMTTLDGLRYDLQSVGEFNLAASTTPAFQLQERLCAASATWSSVCRVAAQVGDHIAEVDATSGVIIDHTATNLDVGDSISLGDGPYIERSTQSDYMIVWGGGGSDDPAILLHVDGNASSLSIHAPTAGFSDLTGLIGNDNGDPSDDLRFPDGQQLGANPSSATIHGSFADAWRVTGSDSLFTYSSGKTTADFTDKSYPQNVITIDDIDPTVRTYATDACENAGVVPGPQFDDCVLDVARTSDQKFAALASQSATPLLGVGDLMVDANGDASVNFDSTVPPNFNSGGVVTYDASGQFAGPFSGDSTYRYYLPQMPHYLGGTVSFDLIALGDWSDSTTEKLSLSVDGSVAWSHDFTTTDNLQPSRAGELADGTSYRVYTITTPFQGLDPTLSGVFSATGVDGLANKAFGIDNLIIHANLVPPQSFGLGALGSSALSVSDGVPAAGAGNLETAASEDDYSFSLAAAKSVEMTFNCSSMQDMMNWSVVNTDTNQTVVGSNTCQSLVRSLAAGNYQVTITSYNGRTGTYGIGLLAVPAAQVFDLGSVSGQVSVSDGVPAAGAGRLETEVSQDVYQFTLDAPRTLLVTLAGAPSAQWEPWVLHEPDGSTVSKSGNDTLRVDSAAAGAYELTVGRGDGPIAAGAYSMTFATSGPQSFGLGALGSSALSVSDGVPAAGAGNLETAASEDDYSFSLAAAKSVEMTFNCSSMQDMMNWSVVNTDTNQTVVGSNTCQSLVRSLAAGNYQVTITSYNGRTGTYGIGLLAVPAAQVFDLGSVSGQVSVSDGVPAAGAGRLETEVSQDVYQFTLDAPRTLLVTLAGAPSAQWEPWVLHEPDGSTVSKSGNDTLRVDSAAAGAYELTVGRGDGPIAAGAYSMTFATSGPQSFGLGALGSSALSVSDGVPAAGAGNLETAASEDDYSFSLAAAKSVEMTFNCSSMQDMMNWSVVNTDTNQTVVGSNTCQSLVRSLAAGNYQVTITSYNGRTGTYGINLA